MPIRKQRGRKASSGLTEAAYTYFSYGAFFEGETFEERTSPEERAEIWKTHKESIIARWRSECPHQPPDFKTHGEVLEKREAVR
jgi:hypothetical protein